MNTAVIQEIEDYTYLDWTKTRHSSSTAGSFLKAFETGPTGKIYYKLSDFDAYKGIIGHECVNEIITDRLLTILKIPHVSYQLVHARVLIAEQEYETWMCRSEDFKKPGESKIALDMYYQMERLSGETPLEFCIRMGWGEYICQMLIVDFLILNRDRHGANMEVLQDRVHHEVRLAPLFDHGLSFFFSAHTEEELRHKNGMDDRPVQCFVGSRSAKENLQLIPAEARNLPGKLQENDRGRIFEGLDEVLSFAYQEAIWQMLWKRWQFYESFCHS